MMHTWGVSGYANYYYPFWVGAFFGPLLIIIVLWSLFWKGLALWHSSRRGSPWWFVILLVVNTAGILEIVYLFGFAKLKFDQLFKMHHVHGENH